MDATEAIIQRIRQMENPPCHVGEVIPQDLTDYPYVFIMKNREAYEEGLCYPREKIAIRYDVEVVSDDINQARDLTARIKSWLMQTPLHGLHFQNDFGAKQTIQGIDVEDHDDSYMAKFPDSDERIFVAAIDVEAILGQIF
jgi:hypothetical protein